MAYERKTLRRTMTPAEREDLSKQIGSAQAMATATKDVPEGDFAPATGDDFPINKDRLREKIKRMQKVLDERTPERVTNPAHRQKLVAERKRLAERFGPFIETWKDLGAIKTDSPEYRDARKKAEQRPKVEADILRYRELGKMLEPDDPHINDLDEFRQNQR